jgi:superfamily I DNA/RNA helicase
MNKPVGKVTEFINTLNKDQRKAVLEYITGPLAIVSSAGSGKTRTLIARILNLIVNLKVDPHNVLAITFTREAAQEMRLRLEKMLGFSCAGLVNVTNFHQLCLRIIRENFEQVGFGQQPLVVGEFEQREIVKNCVSQVFQNVVDQGSFVMTDEDPSYVADAFFQKEEMVSLGGEDVQNSTVKVAPATINFFVNVIRKIKEKSLKPEELDKSSCAVFTHYIKYMQKLSAIDLSDMIPLALKLFEK